MPAATIWNTGCRRICNALNVAIELLDGEERRAMLKVAARSTADGAGALFPWCENGSEVFSKAFRVVSTRSGKTLYWLYQDYVSSRICFTPGNAIANRWLEQLQPPAAGQLSTPDFNAAFGLSTYLWTARRYLACARGSRAYLDPQGAIELVVSAEGVWGTPASQELRPAEEILGDIDAGAIGLVGDLL